MHEQPAAPHPITMPNSLQNQNVLLSLSHCPHHSTHLLTLSHGLEGLMFHPTQGAYQLLLFFFFLINLFIFGCVGSSLLRAGFSLLAASGDYSSLWCASFSLRWLLLLWNTGSRHAGFSSCGTWAQ